MKARLHHLAIDCPDPEALAAFYATLLDQPVSYRDPDWVVVAPDNHTSGLAFQRVADFRAPTWPTGAVPQQLHLDVMVEDPAAARDWVLGLGASHLAGDVYADPVGHPFCLITRPGWAPPLEP